MYEFILSLFGANTADRCSIVSQKEPEGKIGASFCFLAEFLSMSIFLQLASCRVVISGWIIKYHSTKMEIYGKLKVA